MHEKHKGKIAISPKVEVKTRDDLSTAYTPGVAEPCRKIRDNKEDVYRYTAKGNLVAVVSDGTAVLGLGDIGPEAAMPVMEGKALLFKEFADIDAFPICLDTKDTEEIIETVKRIAPVFGGINLEDISAPRCFEIERRLKEELDIRYSMMTSMEQRSLLQRPDQCPEMCWKDHGRSGYRDQWSRIRGNLHLQTAASVWCGQYCTGGSERRFVSWRRVDERCAEGNGREDQ